MRSISVSVALNEIHILLFSGLGRCWYLSMSGKFVEMVDLRLDTGFTKNPNQVIVYPRGIVACGIVEAENICAAYDMFDMKWSVTHLNLPHNVVATYAPNGKLHVFFYDHEEIQPENGTVTSGLYHIWVNSLNHDVREQECKFSCTTEKDLSIDWTCSLKAATTVSCGENQNVKIYVANEKQLICFTEDSAEKYLVEKIDLDFHFDSGCMVAAEDSLYFIQAGKELRCKIFNTHSKTFTEKRPPKLRSDSTSTAVYFAGQIYLFNGSPKQERTYLQIYDIKRDKWNVSKLKMPCGLTGTTAVLMNSYYNKA